MDAIQVSLPKFSKPFSILASWELDGWATLKLVGQQLFHPLLFLCFFPTLLFYRMLSSPTPLVRQDQTPARQSVHPHSPQSLGATFILLGLVKICFQLFFAK